MSVQSYVPSYLYDSADSEEEPEKYQYTEEGFEKRDREVMLSIQQTKTDKLLSDAKLYDNEPITNINIGSEPTEPLVTCELADKALARSNKVYPIQRTVWPHILRGSSAILVGDTEYYPHLLYLPAVCGLIEVRFNGRALDILHRNSVFTNLNFPEDGKRPEKCSKSSDFSIRSTTSRKYT